MNRIRRTLVAGLVAGSLFVAALSGASANAPGGTYDPNNPPVIPPEWYNPVPPVEMWNPLPPEWMWNPIPTLPTGPNLISPGYK